MKKRNRGLFEIHFAILLVGMTGLFGKLITESAYFLVFSRMLLAFIGVGIYIKILGKSFKLNEAKDYRKIVYTGILLAVHWVSFFISIQISTVAIGLLSFSSFPIFTTFLEPIFFKEKIARINVLTALIVFAGLVIIIPEYDFSNNIFLGIIWGMLSGLAYSVLAIENRRLVSKYGAVNIVFYQNLFGAVFVFPLIFMDRIDLSANDIYFILILGLVCTALAHSLFINGLRFVKAQTASVITSMEPVYGVVFAFFLLGEIPPVRTILGGIIIILGIFINLKYHKSSQISY